ncbi:hypothetical protein J8C02_07500 [Chloracidobacterium sp. MS 40/45]|uniref:hypothetical protein n=1 Tax=Chloracidobacterium aggregatum TaxID=2851959 RepID=UPI001B8C775A|nr:hypothetical protein [Chloracidobacterium aggregatum]QUV99271.1 hypothetical protein J8C02_07500 [Chloracidobacterium sp. MS 40/45]
MAETAYKKLAFQNDPRGWINCRDKPFLNVCVVVYALSALHVNVKTGTLFTLAQGAFQGGIPEDVRQKEKSGHAHIGA